MNRGKLNRGQRPQRDTAAIIAERDRPLVCRHCKEFVPRAKALGSKKAPKCPACGGPLDPKP